MFVSSESIKKGCWTKVDKGVFGDKPAVQKQYFPEQTVRYLSEKKNLSLMRGTCFDSFVDTLEEQDENNVLIFPFIDGDEGYAALEKDPGNLKLLFWAMAKEMKILRKVPHSFSFVPDGLKRTNYPLTYSRLLQQSDLISPKQKSELEVLMKSPIPSLVWGRYDPEVSNLIISGKKVFHIDYGSMALQHPLFPFAYASVHLLLSPLPEQTKRSFDLDKLIALTKDCSWRGSYRPSGFEHGIKLAFAEVCGYLALESRRLFHYDPSYRTPKNEAKIQGSLDILEKILVD